MQQIEALDVQRRLAAGEQLVLLDVREPNEVAYCRIPESTHIRMNEIPARLQELHPQDTIVVYCHAGGRSAKVCQFLEANGFANVLNLRGGITQWSLQVDPTVPRY